MTTTTLEKLLGRIEDLGAFTKEGTLITTPQEVIDATTELYGAEVADMVEKEPLDFLEGFVSALLLYKTLHISVLLSATIGDTPEDSSQELLDAQIDTVITLLVEHIEKARNLN